MIPTGGAILNKVPHHRVRVGILGATGMVGQRFVQLLENHPGFVVTALAASDRSQGKQYGESLYVAAGWRHARLREIDGRAADASRRSIAMWCSPACRRMSRVQRKKPSRAPGYPVISNASSFRMDADVPLMIPEINADHLDVLTRHAQERGFGDGYIVTNPNCSTNLMALALAPLHTRVGIEAVIATTLQAVSGAGYPGVPSLDVVDNVIPSSTEKNRRSKARREKILVSIGRNGFENAPFAVSAQCHQRERRRRAHSSCAREAWQKCKHRGSSRSALLIPVRSAKLKLHSAPEHPVIVRNEKDRPQPRLDRDGRRRHERYCRAAVPGQRTRLPPSSSSDTTRFEARPERRF